MAAQFKAVAVTGPRQSDTHPLRGALFENWVILEQLKDRYNRGLRNNLYFWRNNTGHEIDLLMDQGGQLTPVEIKSGQTFADDWLGGLKKWLLLAGGEAHAPKIIYAGDESWEEDGIRILSWREATRMS